jgi:hypothetical protein
MTLNDWKRHFAHVKKKDLEKDVERGDSWEYSGFSKTLLKFPSLDSFLKIYQNMFHLMGYPNGVRSFEGFITLLGK